MPDLDSALDDDIGDELLRLIFTACHPRLPREARAALALRMICGLTTEEIARAFFVPNGTIAQRIVRAKRTLSESGLTYETPLGDEISARFSSVLEVVYLIFNEGYTAASGEQWQRPQLCNEALRLGRVLTSIAPHEPEAHGLMALMELNASRMSARTDAAGEPILMLDQNRALWDQFQIRRGMQALARAHELSGAGGVYALQAAIVACHAQARTAKETDWSRISTLYAELATIAPSPIIELNRAVAVSMAEGPEAALAIVDRLVRDPRLKTYHLLLSVRGDLLDRLGRYEEARAEFEAAAGLAGNSRKRDLLRRRGQGSVDENVVLVCRRTGEGLAERRRKPRRMAVANCRDRQPWRQRFPYRGERSVAEMRSTRRAVTQVSTTLSVVSRPVLQVPAASSISRADSGSAPYCPPACTFFT
jgi:predicted RNA polymerase sigma factor